MRAYPLFPFDPARNVEVFYIEFDAGVQHDSVPHVEGVEEYIFLVQGALKMIIGGGKKGSCFAGKAVHTVWGGYFPHIP